MTNWINAVTYLLPIRDTPVLQQHWNRAAQSERDSLQQIQEEQDRDVLLIAPQIGRLLDAVPVDDDAILQGTILLFQFPSHNVALTEPANDKHPLVLTPRRSAHCC